MSDEKKTSEALKKFQDALEKDKAEDKRKQELKDALAEKKLIVENYRYSNELEKINQSESDMARLSNLSIGEMTDEEMIDTMELNKAYLDGAKNGMLFLNESFRKFVPCWPGNIVLVGARTGGGKSSATANLILSTINQLNTLTGKNRKVLCISCEETPIQVYNRLTCLVKGWNYNEMDEFTDDQKQTLIDLSGKWSKNGVTVVGDDGHGLTDSIEGIKSIFENLVKNETYYDMVLIDYIQKIVNSKKNPKTPQYTILKDVMNVLDFYKNIYPAAIVVTAQLSSQRLGDPENEIDFQDRIRGCKDIITPCTVALEMVPDIQNLKTRWIVRKNRYKGSTVGGHRDTAYDRGMFRPITDEWERTVAIAREKKNYAESVGKHVDKKVETKE